MTSGAPETQMESWSPNTPTHGHHTHSHPIHTLMYHRCHTQFTLTLHSCHHTLLTQPYTYPHTIHTLHTIHHTHTFTHYIQITTHSHSPPTHTPRPLTPHIHTYTYHRPGFYIHKVTVNSQKQLGRIYNKQHPQPSQLWRGEGRGGHGEIIYSGVTTCTHLVCNSPEFG